MKAKVWTLVISHKHGDDLTVHGSKEDANRAIYAYVGGWWRREMGDEETQTGNDEQDARDYFEKTEESANIEEHEIELPDPPELRTKLTECLGELRYIYDTNDVADSLKNSADLRDNAAILLGYSNFEEWSKHVL